LFERRVEFYDALIDWPKRLAREEPFFRAAFEQVAARRVLDAACGTGRHAALFHSWGLPGEGADVSQAMIERCRRRYGQSAGLSWVVRGFDQPPPAPGVFDAAICIGNSLALARDREQARRAVAALLAALRPGGVCVIQLLNLWSLPEGPCVWQKFRQINSDGQTRLLIKGIHRHADHGFVEFIAVPLETAGQAPTHEASRLIGLGSDDLSSFARAAGGRGVEFFGSYARDAYERELSGDLIALIEKA
jgi:SAM-dependent methyltransferase